ncbi:MAG: hypothetical protein JO032_08250 [Alphaproteobacteria bacterium]|nr:hypothetical protein [Alphaproteobacteria bacterium]
MDRNDDVQRLFSWLQTPDLRYREFADARDVPDVAPAARPRPPAGRDDAAAGAPPAAAEPAPRPRGPLRQPEFSEPVSPPAAPAHEAAGHEAPGEAGHEAPGAGATAAAGAPGLLGGAYRGTGQPPGAAEAVPEPAPGARQAGGNALDSVFGRLGRRNRSEPDDGAAPRPGERPPPGGRSR